MYFYPRSPCGERHLPASFHPMSFDFYPRSPCGERHKSNGSRCTSPQFLSTLSLRRATAWPLLRCERYWHISIHALLAESDIRKNPIPCQVGQFLSTLSLRRATGGTTTSLIAFDDFYPRSPCGERRTSAIASTTHQTISIHALLAESDLASPVYCNAERYFYPRSPCGERPFSSLYGSAPALFLSTLSLRRATHRHGLQKQVLAFLSTLSLRRATTEVGIPNTNTSKFLSTLSLRRATNMPPYLSVWI